MSIINEGLEGVTGDYRLLEDGSVEVYNKGYLNTLDGPLDEILGNAVVADTVSNARLKVKFPGVPNFPFPNYLIVVLDDISYEYAVVSDPFRFTLFVLSRTPQMPPEVYAQIIAQLQGQGSIPQAGVDPAARRLTGRVTRHRSRCLGASVLMQVTK